MKKQIDRNSGSWCDMIFFNRNKKYGAYLFRQSTHKDHIRAFFVSISVFILIVFILKNINFGQPLYECGGGCPAPFVTYISDIMLEPPSDKENEIYPSVNYPTVKVVSDSSITKVSGESSEGIFYDTQADTLEHISTFSIPPCQTEEDNIVLVDFIPKHNITEFPPVTCGGPHSSDIPPAFPGGESELNRYLKQKIRYPYISIENGTEGRVVVQFTVNNNGSIQDIEIIKSLDYFCDREVIKAISKMPKWIPGRVNGRRINIKFLLPVTFNIKNR